MTKVTWHQNDTLSLKTRDLFRVPLRLNRTQTHFNIFKKTEMTFTVKGFTVKALLVNLYL